MSDWYARQFGDRERFAISVSLGRDPHPIGDAAVDSSWGGISLWIRGRCLTRSVSTEGGVCDEVRWNLVSIIRWFLDVGVRLVNEEPFPEAATSDSVRDACDWINTTETPLVTLSAAEEDEWFLRRSDWRQHHSLRRAAVDVALPNVFVRRLGDFVEVSWDNETWAAPKSGLSFVEQRGTEIVPSSTVALQLSSALVDVTRALADRHPDVPEFVQLASAATELRADDEDWRWLVHAPTARVICAELRELYERLIHHTRTQRDGLYVPHAPETLVLRHARLVSTREVTSLLEASKMYSPRPMSEHLCRLIQPAHPSASRPWVEGYEKALDLREALGWGNEPAPDLRVWMSSNHVSVKEKELSTTVDLVTRKTADRASAVVNPQTSSNIRREIGYATVLGHILFDDAPVAVDGAWEHWPTAARARAFAAMLLMPDDGVRDVLAGRQAIDASDVRRVMQRFNTGPYATTYHLKNRGFIPDDERRMDILRELVA
ncbi:hypothetical protein [Sorangium sp. So ce1335]|uniref:hypothetical protein n=1 Tax=Sorangium sp. So ce1335 TaxID=3133335 RepID=UPI003F60BAED